MGVRYIHSMLITPQRNWVSRKNTIMEASSSPMPKANRNRQMMGNGSSRILTVRREPVSSRTMPSGIRDRPRFTVEEMVRDSGYIYFGTYTLVIRAVFPVMEVRQEPVTSLKKFQQTIPLSRYTGKFTMLDLNSVENTIYMTIIVSRGFIKLHSTPRMLRLYLVLKSRCTSCLSKKRYRVAAASSRSTRLDLPRLSLSIIHQQNSSSKASRAAIVCQ